MNHEFSYSSTTVYSENLYMTLLTLGAATEAVSRRPSKQETVLTNQEEAVDEEIKDPGKEEDISGHYQQESQCYHVEHSIDINPYGHRNC